MYGLEGWKATSKMLSSNFFLCAVISWTHVLLSRFHSLKVANNTGRRKQGEKKDIVRGDARLYVLWRLMIIFLSKPPDAAIVAARYKVEAMLVHCQTCHAVQVGHHAGQSSRLTRFLRFFNSPVHQGSCVVVVESYVSVLVTGYRQRQSRVGEHCVDWTHRL